MQDIDEIIIREKQQVALALDILHSIILYLYYNIYLFKNGQTKKENILLK